MRRIVALLIIVLTLVGIEMTASISTARDIGQWDNVATSKEVKEWYKKLMRPDSPEIACCGDADAYWADGFEVSEHGEYVAIITDTRDDGPLGREHIPVGTRIIVPKEQLKWDQGNPTGHGIIFISQGGWWQVLCYCPPGGG